MSEAILCRIEGETFYDTPAVSAFVYIDGGIYIDENYRVPSVRGGKNVYISEEKLTKKIIHYEDEQAHYTAIEYWQGEQLGNRSAHVVLKKGLDLKAEQGAING